MKTGREGSQKVEEVVKKNSREEKERPSVGRRSVADAVVNASVAAVTAAGALQRQVGHLGQRRRFDTLPVQIGESLAGLDGQRHRQLFVARTFKIIIIIIIII